VSARARIVALLAAAAFALTGCADPDGGRAGQPVAVPSSAAPPLGPSTAPDPAAVEAGLAARGGASAAPPPVAASARSAAEQRTGDRAHPQILAQYGGAYEGPVAAYVRDVGMRLVARTEQPRERWTFTVLDTPEVNAFALPGGYVYVTRGLIALADDEAELAGVIGHEIGHVTARHSAGRQQRAGLAQLGVLAAVVGAAALGVEGPALDAIGQGASAIGQGAVASYSREQEFEADALGVRYLAAAGYDPFAQADFLESMQAQSALSARLAGGAYDPNRVSFFATHPAAADRARQAAALAAGTGAQGGPRDRDRFLSAIDGLTYGDSARQGFVRGRRFVHPELRFAFEAPPGFVIANSAAAVTMRGPNGAAIVFDGGRDPGGALDAYVARGWAGEIARQSRTGDLQGLRRFSVGGYEAATADLPVATRGGVKVARLVAIRAEGGRIYRFTGLADPRDARGLDAALAAAASFRGLSAAEARAERPWRVRVVTVKPGETSASLAAAMPFDRLAVERFRVLNGLAPGQEPRAGDRVKIVVP
jgi:predicted Zn-dependent protease